MSRRYNLNNSSRPSGSTGTSTGSTAPPPSPAPASGNSTASSKKASQNAVSPGPGVLLGISGGWLIARMFLFGGSLWLLEIIAIATMAGFAHSKGGKGQKKFAKAIIGFAILNLLFPGLNSWIKGFRESQLNPPTTEQSAEQPQQVAPAPVEEIPSTERVVVAGRKITLTGDGTYTIPAGKKSLCFTHLGIKDGSTRVPQELSMNGEIFNTLGTKCFELREDLSGVIIVDFFPEKDYGSPSNIVKVYNYWRSQPGGQAEWPIIRIGE